MAERQLRSSDKIALLQDQYRSQIPSRIEELKRLWHQYSESGDPDTLRELRRSVHSLAGSSGTFGAPLVSSQARYLERALHTVMVEGRAFSLVEREYVLGALQRLHEVSLVEASAAKHGHADMVTAESLMNRRIYVIDDDPALCLMLASELEQKGFSVEIFESVNDLLLRYQQCQPAAIIMDLASGADFFTAANGPAEAPLANQVLAPIVAMSVSSDIQARLHAVRLGAKRFLIKPFEPQQAVQAVLGVVCHVVDEPYRVLIVDDDEDLADYYQALLSGAGMQVHAIADPLLCLDTLREFRPELVLMDVYMPGCTGLELAAVIRQDDNHATLPIIFVSTEEKIDRQMTALNLGGDDFITKPVLPDHLLQAVTARLKRNRRIKELNGELAKAFRLSSTLRDAMERHDLVSVTDVEGVITYANDNFCQVSGYRREELVGQTHRIVNSGTHTSEYFVDMWDTISQGRIWHGTLCNRAKSGAHYWVESTIVPFLDSNGLPYQYVSIRTDVTRLKNVEEHLRESRQRLHLSQAFAHMGTWDLNTATRELFLAENAAPIFGMGAQARHIDFQEFLSRVHPEDEALMSATIRASVERGCEYKVEYRYTWPDGSVHWIEGRGDVNRSSEDNGVHLLGIVQDISGRKSLEQDIERQKTLLNLLRNGMNMFMTEEQFSNVAEYLLQGMMLLLESTVGFVGEVKLDDQGKPWLYPHALLRTDENVKPNIKPPLSLLHHASVVLPGLAPVYEPVLTCGQQWFDNEIQGIEFQCPEHGDNISIRNAITLPIYYGDRFVGIFGLMNATHGFNADIVQFLMPFVTSYGVLIHAFQAQCQQQDMRQELVISRDQAERANRMKSRFLSAVSHELRTPLNAILGFGQLLQVEDEPALTCEQQENVLEILNAGQHLLRLVNDILDLAKLEAGKITLECADVEVGMLVETTMVLMRPIATLAQVTLEYDLPKFHGKRVWADAMRLKQILINLIANAIKYNRIDGQVVVDCCARDDAHLAISIMDTGVGISPESISQMFVPFGRLDAEQKGIPGTGIGLVLSRELTHMMGGELELSSQPGVGTTLCLVLPTNSSVPKIPR